MVSPVGLFVVFAFIGIFVALIYMGSQAEEGNKNSRKGNDENKERKNE